MFTVQLSNFFSKTADYNPLLDLQNADKLLDYVKENSDKIGEALALSRKCDDYRQFGEKEKSLQFGLQSQVIAMAVANKKLICYTKINLGQVYRDLGKYTEAIKLFMFVSESATSINYIKGMLWASQSLSEVYILSDQIDSALIYAQKDYEIAIRTNYKKYLGYTLLNLGIIHGKLKNTSLAISFYNMAIKEGIDSQFILQLSSAYSAKATYLSDINQIDSSIRYAKKAIAIIQNTPFTNYCLKPAKLLLDVYRNRNTDSAFRYSEIYHTTHDSLFNIKIMQHTQLMVYENELRQQLAEKERRKNIQLILLAAIFMTLIILFLILSRSFITNTKVIKILGTVALLIIFEFFNLLLHPFLDKVTNHSPTIILVALVCIAALLVPLHHKIEKWAIVKLIEKNKQLRLTAAKKTIELLENKTEDQ